MNWHSQSSIYGTTIIGQVGLIFGRNWNGKQLDQVEKEYRGIFNNRRFYSLYRKSATR